MSKVVADWLVNNFLIFVLMFVRILGLMVMAPVFSSRSIPERVKAGLALVITMAIFPVARPASVVVPTTLTGLTVAVLGETMVGLILGFGAAVIFAGIELAGELISRQMGTALAGVLNPMFETQVPVMSQFYSLFALMIFLGMNGHLKLLTILIDTFQRIPLMQFRLTGSMAKGLVGLLQDSYVVAIQVSAPVLVSLLMVTIALGIIARTVPTMNVLVMGFPLQIGLALVVSVLTLGAVAVFFQGTFQRMFAQLEALLASGIQ